ncbi:hypothetical protein NQZ79_g1981 [Umbelopsis isabellina]|nr:hypothetical protein NQZ79_g1981 [Umbelopsis isabellina]
MFNNALMLQSATRSKETFLNFPRTTPIREKPSIRLRKAIKDGNIFAVKRLLRKVNNIQNPDPDTGMTSLLLAAQHGHTELVNYLISMGHEDEIISLDKEDNTVLMLAAINNQEEIFYSYALEYPECIHAINKHGWSVLLFAAKNGNTNIVEYLLQISADVDHVDDDGNSALHHAAAWGHTQVRNNANEVSPGSIANSLIEFLGYHVASELANMHLEEVSAATTPRQSVPLSVLSEASSGRQQSDSIYRHRHSSSYESNSKSDIIAGGSSIPSAVPAPLAASLSSSSSYLQNMSVGSPQSQDAFGEYRGRTTSVGDQTMSPRLRGT